ncbi:uncharacterized protein N7459_004448 [Penicillium hispanicum]|uniref:uncharacterized protein n=1 Tax=Penicillium hispanicum TaxID=1080232 RepID=UPI002540E888|nr:uncharacterized protein N7459_004448 [Penicillium hispanicum]KAJ5584648.1 hypothetical protein N7459_004448 [Penicillium hispanicum]
MSPTIPQENVDRVLEYVLPHVKKHTEDLSASKRPFVLGLTGLQGSGKSTWTDALVKVLRDRNYQTINVSLDDFYHDHDELVALRTSNASNKLFQTRGQPGTHDIELSRAFFKSLHDSSEETLIPFFDKSLFNGEGGRAPPTSWQRIPSGTAIDIVIFEGWCVGFQPLDDNTVRARWSQAKESQSQKTGQYPTETLQDHAIEHLLEVNNNLRQYCELFMGPQHFDFLVHLDTDDLINVYEWRVQQEHALRQRKNGGGMTDDEVVEFVKGYMPAYELYLDQLREWFFRGIEGKEQLRVVLDKSRKIKDIQTV